jgi:dTMP kinase
VERRLAQAKTKRGHSGKLITFEGIDGCGKTTQAALVQKKLSSLGFRTRLLREPGSTKIAEKIRRILLDKSLSITDHTELLLYEAARAELVAREIKPLLIDGYIVLCDRFFDSTTAYQGYGRKLDLRMVRSLHRVAVGELVPDLTLLYDIDLATAASRRGKEPDRLESQSKAFFNRVRLGFLEIARKERRRVKLIHADRPIDAVFCDTASHIEKRLKIDGLQPAV